MPFSQPRVVQGVSYLSSRDEQAGARELHLEYGIVVPTPGVCEFILSRNGQTLLQEVFLADEHTGRCATIAQVIELVTGLTPRPWTQIHSGVIRDSVDALEVSPVLLGRGIPPASY